MSSFTIFSIGFVIGALSCHPFFSKTAFKIGTWIRVKIFRKDPIVIVTHDNEEVTTDHDKS